MHDAARGQTAGRAASGDRRQVQARIEPDVPWRRRRRDENAGTAKLALSGGGQPRGGPRSGRPWARRPSRRAPVSRVSRLLAAPAGEGRKPRRVGWSRSPTNQGPARAAWGRTSPPYAGGTAANARRAVVEQIRSFRIKSVISGGVGMRRNGQAPLLLR
jgi:hypothetical protein